MESELFLSEPASKFIGGLFLSEKSSSMTVLNSPNQIKVSRKPRMATLETLEAKMANIEESLSLSATRRRKGTSIGSASTRSSPKLDCSSTHSKEMRSALQDREVIMQNLRTQLGLAKLPRPTGPPFDESERPVAEQRLNRLKTDAENKKVAIRNLKSALEKLDITENIDTRIRQAELEYALGREELQLLSIVEEARAIQARLEKSKQENNTLFSLIQNGQVFTLYAVQATTGRWNAKQRCEGGGFYVDYVNEGEDLYRGDRILEVNGTILTGNCKDELQKLISSTTKCDIVVIRKKNVVNIINQNQLQQSQADNVRLQHRISYLEEQVKELLAAKELNEKLKSSPTNIGTMNGHGGTHITSISISSSPNTQSDHDDDKPTVYQRGSFITTLVNGKPLDPLPPSSIPTSNSKSNHKSSSRTSISNSENHKDLLPSKTMKHLSTSLSRISISTDLYAQKREREKRLKNSSNGTKSYNHARSVEVLNQQNLEKSSIASSMNHIESSYARRKYGKSNLITNGHHHNHNHNHNNETRSIKSLDFDSDIGQVTDDKQDTDAYASEPVQVPRIRPTPPKKPLRLSLQRAQSLQAVVPDTNGLTDTTNLSDKKRAMKRLHKSDVNGNDKTLPTSRLNSTYSRSIEFPSKYLESSLTTSSLGRHKYV